MPSASPRTVRRLDSAGKLPRGIRLGGLKRWRADELKDWIAAGCPPAQGMGLAAAAEMIARDKNVLAVDLPPVVHTHQTD